VNQPATKRESVRLTGPLTLDTVPALHARSRAWFSQRAQLELDLSAISQTDSAGLALLVTWLSEASASGGSLRFVSPPESLSALVRINGLSAIFPNGVGG